jgi:hypothetical protein
MLSTLHLESQPSESISGSGGSRIRVWCVDCMICGGDVGILACLVGSVWLVKGIAIRGERDEATCCPTKSRVLGFDSLASLVTLLHNFYLWLQNIA